MSSNVQIFEGKRWKWEVKERLRVQNARNVMEIVLGDDIWAAKINHR